MDCRSARPSRYPIQRYLGVADTNIVVSKPVDAHCIQSDASRTPLASGERRGVTKVTADRSVGGWT
jgi:hypothetical protein